MGSEIETIILEPATPLLAVDEATAETGSVFTNFDRRTVSVTPAGDAVLVLNAMKSYQSGHPVLNGLNMTVPCGSIYGLLGSSGCGKTTVLSCIVGVKRLDRGKIWIFGKKPGSKSLGVPGRNIGYMPQELSLYPEFSIGETLNYFGTLSGMSMDDIRSEKKMLADLIDLPPDSRRVGSLSGGQQRRVSLTVALLHKPELLILDEPTAGVDPLVRQNIWLYLQQLVQSKRTTIIITTHYIEECRNADNIGLMRNGRLLEEAPPKTLMMEYGTSNLETIILEVSKKDTVQSSLSLNVNAGKPTVVEEVIKIKGPPGKMANVLHDPTVGFKDILSRITALTLKNFVILYRNPLLLFFVIMFACLLALLICFTLGGDPKGLTVGLVNKEVANYLACRSIIGTPGKCPTEMSMLSCYYLSNLKKGALVLKSEDNEAGALADVHSGSSWGYITFPSNFSASLYNRFASGSNVSELIVNASEFVVNLDESNQQISIFIKKTLFDAYQDFTSFLANCTGGSGKGDPALKYLDPIYGTDTTDFREFLVPGTAVTVLFFFPIITTSIRYIKEKKNGVFHRSIVGGVKSWEIMVAYSISEFCVILLQSLLCYIVIHVLFDIKVKGSDALVLILFVLAGYGGISMGFLLGSVFQEEIEAAMLAMAIFLPNLVLSGILWPREGMHVCLQYVIQFLPCTLPAEAIRSITSRGWEFSHPDVWPGFAVIVGCIAAHFMLTVLFHIICNRY